jgi:hypothetical protein
LAETDRDFSTMVHIVGPSNSIISSRRTFPGLGRYPTSIWQGGEIWCDLIHLPVAQENVPRTLVYKVEVALLDPDSDARLPLFDALGAAIEVGFAADVLIESDSTEQAPGLSGDEPMTLLDYRIESTWRLDENNPFVLYWAVPTPVPADYQLFVHLRDTESGETIAQADGPPVGGWYPTSKWVPGTVIHDERLFPLVGEIEPGSYDLVVGFYDLSSFERVGREYFLETIEVQP